MARSSSAPEPASLSERASQPPGDDFTRWQPPAMDRSASLRVLKNETPAVKPPTAAQMEQWQKEAREAGHKQGYQEGLAAGRAAGEQALRQAAAQLQSVATALGRPLQEFDAEAEQELAELAFIIARQIIRRELRTDPGEIIGLVREALALLPANARTVELRLHPEDQSLVRDNLNLTEGASAIRLIEDPSISRGGCQIHADPTRIDATLETRLNQLSAAILGGERDGDQ